MQDQSTTPAISTEATATVATQQEVASTTTEAPSFITQIPEEYRAVKSLQGMNDWKDVLKSYVHKENLIGKKIQDYASADLQGFLGKLGRPESPEKYVFPEEIGNDYGQKLRGLAYKVGLNQEQAKMLADDVIMANRQNMEAAQSRSKQEAEARLDALKQEFGSALDNRIGVAERAVYELGGDEFMNMLHETNLNTHPVMVKFLAKIGKEFLEEAKVVEGDKRSHFGETPKEAEFKIAEKFKDKEFMAAWKNPMHRNHESAIKEISGLYKAKKAGSVSSNKL